MRGHRQDATDFNFSPQENERDDTWPNIFVSKFLYGEVMELRDVCVCVSQ